jgi:hypothetical protein
MKKPEEVQDIDSRSVLRTDSITPDEEGDDEEGVESEQ